MSKFRSNAIYGAGIFAIVLAATMLGNSLSQNNYSEFTFDSELPITLNADAATRGKSMSMATGFIDRDELIEGVFVLDHLSGNLQCW
ncbi:MAG: hypothetical protein AAGA30_01700, partial [Planctomycetota bacterium]